VNDKSKPLGDLFVERGWVTAGYRAFLEKKAERKPSRHQNDPRVTLNEVTCGLFAARVWRGVDFSNQDSCKLRELKLKMDRAC
jgi:hypothetical protein